MNEPRRLAQPINRNAFRSLVFDLDGTAYLNGVPIDDIVLQLNRHLAICDGQGIALTNNTSFSKDQHLVKLGELGFDMERVSVLTPTEVAAEALRGRKLTRGYLIGTRAFVEEMAAFGVAHDETSPSFVLAAFDRELTYEKLETALKFLNEGLPLFQTNIDIRCPTLRGPIPDCGAITQILTTTSGVQPTLDFGKPSTSMIATLRSRLRFPGQAIMVGDRLYTDIALGRAMGIPTLLVLTGDTPSTQAADGDNRPTYIASTFAAFLRDLV
jgi:HAD superfamily hydrolase (TIGR01450 family)